MRPRTGGDMAAALLAAYLVLVASTIVQGEFLQAPSALLILAVHATGTA
jgi:hypothetical protein